MSSHEMAAGDPLWRTLQTIEGHVDETGRRPTALAVDSETAYGLLAATRTRLVGADVVSTKGDGALRIDGVPVYVMPALGPRSCEVLWHVGIRP